MSKWAKFGVQKLPRELKDVTTMRLTIPQGFIQERRRNLKFSGRGRDRHALRVAYETQAERDGKSNKHMIDLQRDTTYSADYLRRRISKNNFAGIEYKSWPSNASAVVFDSDEIYHNYVRHMLATKQHRLVAPVRMHAPPKQNRTSRMHHLLSQCLDTE